MTRPTRMLIVLGLFGVGAVVALSMMAQRYGKLMPRVEPARGSASSSAEPAAPSPAAGRAAAAGSIEAQARALRDVAAFIEARQAMADGPMAKRLLAYPEPGWPLTVDEASALDRALAAAGLDRATYDGILESYGAWEAGREELSGTLRVAFEQRRDELRALE